MGKFHEEHKILIYACTFSGLYMPSIEKLIKYKWVTTCLKIMCLIPIVSMSIMMSSSIKNLFWDEGSFLNKTWSLLIIVSTIVMLFKLFYYNLNRQKFENIFRLWDGSFKENLFSDEREVSNFEKPKT